MLLFLKTALNAFRIQGVKRRYEVTRSRTAELIWEKLGPEAEVDMNSSLEIGMKIQTGIVSKLRCG